MPHEANPPPFATTPAYARAISNFFQTGKSQRLQHKNILLGWEDNLAHMYFIQKGFIKVYSLTSVGDELIHYIYGPGEIFPLSWAFTGVRRGDYYESLNSTLLFRVTMDAFQEFAQSSVLVSNTLVLLVARQLNTYGDRIKNLEHKKPEQRIAYLLVSLTQKFGYQDGGNVIIDGPFTHQLIANTINLARETVSRGLARLEEEGLLEQKNRRIVIKDLLGLQTRVDDTPTSIAWAKSLI